MDINNFNMASYKQNRNFKPKNPEKYKGTFPIFLRSSWEIKFAKWADQHPDVLSWGSESIFIPYYNPIKKKICRYFPDFHMRLRTKSGEIKQYIVEVKPEKETVAPVSKRGKRKNTLLYETATYVVNQSKWQAAIKWCKSRKLNFIVITEEHLYPHRKSK